MAVHKLHSVEVENGALIEKVSALQAEIGAVRDERNSVQILIENREESFEKKKWKGRIDCLFSLGLK